MSTEYGLSFNSEVKFNQKTGGEEMEKKTKEQAQQELQEKFGMKKTSDFQNALRKGDIAQAKEWLQYIEEHRTDFLQYKNTWDSWHRDRVNEIATYETMLASGELKEGESARTKEEAQKELKEKFGMKDTAEFRKTLAKGEIEKCKEWLKHIADNKFQFPQYLGTWNSWYADREEEIKKAEAGK